MTRFPSTAPAALAAALSLLVPAAAAARPAPIDLLHQANVRIVSARPLDGAGTSVAAAGDVNGDGVDDVIVGAPGVDGPGRQDGGAAYVIFGRATRARFTRQAVSARGFRILGARPRAALGYAVAPAGDWNGDGLADVIVGAPWSEHGAAYVVYGKRDGATVDLAVPGPGFTEIDGPTSFGSSLAGGRDVDGDGRPDVVVGAQRIDQQPDDTVGGAYVLRGGAGTSAIDASADLGDRGWLIRSPELGGVSLAGDMNGDGRAEVVLASEQVMRINADGTTTLPTSTVARVVFGRADRTTFDAGAMGPADGFPITTTQGEGHSAGTAVAGGGDVNGDGRGDVVVGAAASNVAPTATGVPYATVVFGSGSGEPVALDQPGPRVLRITGPARAANAQSVAIVRDVDGDGLADVVVGLPSYTPAPSRKGAGAAYLLYGRRAPGTIDVARLPAHRGLVIGGAFTDDAVGLAVSSAGDYNGDGRADLLLPAQFSEYAWDHRGVAYILYGARRR